jgi:NTE family protein
VSGLQASGLEFAYVRTSSYDAATATLTIDVDEGRIRDVEIDPDRPVSRSAVMNEIAFDIDDVATRAAMAQTAKNLRASDVLDAVDVTVLPAPAGGVTVLVGGEDRGNQVIRAGLRVDNERNAQGSMQLAELDLFNSGITVGATVNGGARNAYFGTSITAPRILGSFWTATATAYTSFRNVYLYEPSPEATRARPLRVRDDAFSEDRWGLRISAGRQISRQGVMLAEFRYEDQRYRDRSQRPAPSYTAIGTLKGLVRWDDRDRDDFPTRGRAFDVSLEGSLIGLSQGVGFSKLLLSYQGTQSIARNLALTPALLLGAADRTLPGAELFSLGGQDSFFGMREDEERGRQIVVGRLEGRWRLPFRLFFDTYVAARYDLGAVWANRENIKVEKLQHGVGLTIGFDTPVGPALFSVGRRFYFLTNPNSVALGPTLAYFTVGLRL